MTPQHLTPQQQQQSTQSIADYLAQLLKDRKQLAAFPNVFTHVERLLDEGKKSSRSRGIPHILVFHHFYK